MNNEEKILALLQTMQQDISGLKQGQARLEADVSSLKTGQTRLESDVKEVNLNVKFLWEDVKRIDKRLDTHEEEILTFKRVR